ncbi:hypothetical protein B0T11DRAFT_293790 [Plectosphaerella cucumerina]|uniref:Uncharacterized protein n=1 Tax=Plectosphaerella cucumerina TaxID=40658 RepID=A0A8K0TSY6_9PEZI|nr:hypothetical protein B0T11DRAFT_293790 [Plectosphaerella cucumerina]
MSKPERRVCGSIVLIILIIKNTKQPPASPAYSSSTSIIMKFSAIVLGAFAALALAVPTEIEELEGLEARAESGDAAAFNELVDRQVYTCSKCVDGYFTCCGLGCSRYKC